jgi:hypothetical protein
MVSDYRLAWLDDASDWICCILAVNADLSSYSIHFSIEISLFLYSISSNSWFLSLTRVFLKAYSSYFISVILSVSICTLFSYSSLMSSSAYTCLIFSYNSWFFYWVLCS